jgi:hypothetical protein
MNYYQNYYPLRKDIFFPITTMINKKILYMVDIYRKQDRRQKRGKTIRKVLSNLDSQEKTKDFSLAVEFH